MTLPPDEPRRSPPVYRLLEEAGMIDVPKTRVHSSRWAFEQDELLILALWWEKLDRATCRYSANYRAAALKSPDGRRRAAAMSVDRTVARSRAEVLPIRVIFCTGQTPDGVVATAAKRALDPVSWFAHRHEADGDFELCRGVPAIDQHGVLPTPDAPERVDRAATIYRRDRRLREIALLRAGGRCALCGEPGFALPDGRVYLETHHIVPLCDRGPDHLDNLVALCPNHHREAHFGRDRAAIRTALLDRRSR